MKKILIPAVILSTAFLAGCGMTKKPADTMMNNSGTMQQDTMKQEDSMKKEDAMMKQEE